MPFQQFSWKKMLWIESLAKWRSAKNLCVKAQFIGSFIEVLGIYGNSFCTMPRIIPGTNLSRSFGAFLHPEFSQVLHFLLELQVPQTLRHFSVPWFGDSQENYGIFLCHKFGNFRKYTGTFLCLTFMSRAWSFYMILSEIFIIFYAHIIFPPT